MQVQDFDRFLALPDVTFSEWYAWEKRREHPARNLPGIYLIARFVDQPPPKGSANPLDSNVIAIGETSHNLAQRWREFEKAAFGQGGFHSVGTRYRNKGFPREGLFVAATGSSPLHWAAPGSRTDDELAELIGGSTTASDARKLRRWLERDAPRHDKGPLNTAWVKFVERKLLLEYVLVHKRLPECSGE